MHYVGQITGDFRGPTGAAADEKGNVYVADFTTDMLYKFDYSGHETRRWGGEGAAEGQFSGPAGVAIDGNGNVYVVDAGKGARYDSFLYSSAREAVQDCDNT